MRPLALTLEGFTSFATSRRIDLADLGVFSIGGATGAGKSSILDALLFALYGEVPRTGKAVRELITTGQERLSVVLDFALRGERYRVARGIYRGTRPTEAQLERITNPEDPRILAEGVRPVNDAVVRLLGLDFSAFCRAVVLPQGEFDRFLRGEHTERRRVLTGLLGLEVYERMRAEASTRHGSAKLEVAAFEARLAREFAGVEPAAKEAIEAELVQARASVDEAREAAAAARSFTARMAALAEATLELDAADAALSESEAEAAQLAADQERLSEARRVAPAAPLLDAAAEAEAVAEASRLRAAGLGVVSRRARERLHTAEAANVGPDLGLRSRRDALRAALPRLLAVAGLRREREAVTARQAAALPRCEAAEAAERGAKRRLDACAEAVATAEKAQRTVDRESLDRLARLDPVARVLLAERPLLAEARRAVERQLAELATRDLAVGERRRALGVAGASVRGLAETVAHLEASAHQLPASKLRATLAVGSPCPVCEATVLGLPPPLNVDVAALDAARRRLALAEADAMAMERAVHQAEAQIQAAEQLLAGVQADRDHRQRSLEAARATLGAEPEEVLAAAERATTEAREAERQGQALAAAKQAMQLAAREHEGAAAALAREQGLVAELAAELAGLDQRQRNLEALSSEQRPPDPEAAVLGAPPQVVEGLQPELIASPERALEALEAQVAADDAARAAAAATLDAARLDAARAEASTTMADEEHARHAEAASRAVQALAEVLGRLGLDRAGVARARLEPGATAALEQRVTEAREARMSWLSRRARALELLGGQRVPAPVLEAAREAEAEAGRRAEECLRALVTLETDLAQLVRRLAERAEVAEQLSAADGRQRLWNSLATHLKTDRFQAYLLEETFKELVVEASVRLSAWTAGRLTLGFEGDRFRVVDAEHAGESRAIETLSGGETFLTSLALALALSEHIQRAQGRVQLEALFVDEGFGTLDPERLEPVAEALLSLGESGRLVGVVSHIAELNRQMPTCLRVARAPDGSTVTREDAGSEE